MQQELYALFALVGAITVGAMSPGPSFVMVARTAVALSRAAGLAAALGMGLGGALFALAALAGLQAVFLVVPGLHVALKVLGGAYLVYLGVQIWRGASKPLEAALTSNGEPQRNTFWLGLGTQISNPKTAIVYASVFAALLPAHHSFLLAVLTVLTVFVIETTWYALVAVALSSTRPRAAYLRLKTVVDRVAGSVMMVLGLRLLTSANEP